MLSEINQKKLKTMISLLCGDINLKANNMTNRDSWNKSVDQCLPEAGIRKLGEVGSGKRG